MWSKFNIFTYYDKEKNIKDNYYLNNDSNLVSTLSGKKLSLPFSTLGNSMYVFELLKCNDFLKLNVIINSLFFCKFFNFPEFMSYKLNLYNILNSKNHINKSNFNLYHNIDKTFTQIENNYKIYDITGHSITPPKLCYLYGNLSYFGSANTICIIDDLSNFNNNLSVNFNNYSSYTYDNIIKNKVILIDKLFFISDIYINTYKKFNITNNFKFIKYKQKLIDYCRYKNNFFNLELSDKITFVIKNLDIVLFINHPIFLSSNKIIINYEKISKKRLESCRKRLRLSNHMCRFYLHHIFLDVNKYKLYQRYMEKRILKINNNYSLHKQKFNFKKFNYYCKDKCNKNNIEIGYQDFIVLNCNHTFIYNTVSTDIFNTGLCPICKKNIKNGDIFFNESCLKCNVLGNFFKESLLSKSFKILIYDEFSSLIDLIKNEILIETYDIKNDFEIDYSKNNEIYLLGNINIYDVLNIRLYNDYKFIKLSPDI